MFEGDGEEARIDMPGSLTLDDGRGLLSLLTGGAGLMYAPEPLVTLSIELGQVRLVLQDWGSPGPGFYVYYSSLQHLLTGLRPLIAFIRARRSLGL